MMVRTDSSYEGVRFEWDEAKARENLLKHGVSFETATLVFDDPLVLFMSDEDNTLYEERYLAIGHVGLGTLLFVVHTVKSLEGDLEIIRIISARTAERQERRLYERANGSTTQGD